MNLIMRLIVEEREEMKRQIDSKAIKLVHELYPKKNIRRKGRNQTINLF